MVSCLENFCFYIGKSLDFFILLLGHNEECIRQNTRRKPQHSQLILQLLIAYRKNFRFFFKIKQIGKSKIFLHNHVLLNHILFISILNQN